MNQDDHERFLNALHHKKKVRTHFVRVDGIPVSRLCAPLDFGRVRRAGQPVHYQF